MNERIGRYQMVLPRKARVGNCGGDTKEESLGGENEG